MKHRSNYIRVHKPIHAFTLVELLVVISIIALLLAILMPSLQKAREMAKAVMCMSNMKTTGLCLRFYAEDYDQYIPPFYDTQDPDPGIGRYWVGKLMPYIIDFKSGSKAESQQFMDSKFANTLICPSAPPFSAERAVEKYQDTGDYGDMWSKCIGFRVWMKPGSPTQRLTTSPYYDYKKISDIKRAGEFFTFADSLAVADGANHQWYALIPDTRVPDPTMVTTNPVRTIDMRHSRKANMAFADGHVDKVDSGFVKSTVQSQDEYVQYSRGGSIKVQYYLEEEHKK